MENSQQEPAYREALDYLYQFVDYSLVRNFKNAPEKFDLTRMQLLLTRLNNPHLRYGVVHVAGTKGKGSTAALIANTLVAAGQRVGFYTSPHLSDFSERFQINGQPISHADLVQLINDFRPIITQIENITWFEITTAMAFEWFARHHVDTAVIEVGMGGRLDATNLVSPLVSVITSLSMDHTQILGDTLAKIAFEKAGIIKPGRPVVTANQLPEAQAVLRQVALERNSPLIEIGRDYIFQPLTHSLDGQTVAIWRGGEEESARQTFTIPLLGLHQAENAATAFAAIQILRQQGQQISPEAVQRGFASVIWPGRFELLRRDPPLVVDSAHNRDSARRLRQTLDDYLPNWQVILVFGASEDKDVDGILAELSPRVREVIATQSIHPRAMPADKIVELMKKYGKPAQAILPLEDAIQVALTHAGQDTAILAAGSLFVAAAVRDTWRMKS